MEKIQNFKQLALQIPGKQPAPATIFKTVEYFYQEFVLDMLKL